MAIHSKAIPPIIIIKKRGGGYANLVTLHICMKTIRISSSSKSFGIAIILISTFYAGIHHYHLLYARYDYYDVLVYLSILISLIPEITKVKSKFFRERQPNKKSTKSGRVELAKISFVC